MRCPRDGKGKQDASYFKIAPMSLQTWCLVTRVCVHACVHTHVSMHVSAQTYVGIHICMCMWRPEDSLGYCSSSTIHIFLLRQSISLSWNLCNGLGYFLLSASEGSTYLHLPSAGLTNVHHHSWSVVPRPLRLQCKYLIR